jgi:diguanylate cyclase (GGDEF)-like protein
VSGSLDDTPRFDDESTITGNVGRPRPGDSASRPVLVVESAGALGRYFVLQEGPSEVRIGRGRDAAYRVRDHSVSRSHAIVRVDKQGSVDVLDLDSLNGTFVNAGRVKGSAKIVDGDRLRLGELDMRLRWMTERDLAVQERIARQVRLAERDALTGLHNRHWLLERLPGFVDTAVDRRMPLSLLILDVDRFKAVNDQYGHPAGDEVLAKVGTTIADAIRPEDAAVRAGGEEFWVLLPGAGGTAAASVAERMRRNIAAIRFAPPLHELALTVCVGLATLDRDEATDRWISRADQALLRAKRQGRDRLEVGHIGGDPAATLRAPEQPETEDSDER